MSLEMIRAELFSLCEDTEDRYAEIAQLDLESKPGAFARGRIHEAKSIRNAMGEIFRLAMTNRAAPLQYVWEMDPQFRQALESIKACCEVALVQGPLSRRNALGTIIEIAQAAVVRSTVGEQARKESSDA